MLAWHEAGVASVLRLRTNSYVVNSNKNLESFPKEGIAVIFGSGGGIGNALIDVLRASGHFTDVIGFSRTSSIPIDLLDEASLEQAASVASTKGEMRLVINATGFLHDENQLPEKSWRELDAAKLSRSFAVNSIGPALLMKHVLPRLPRKGKSMFATLSARVASIADNRLGGWYAYRASKAALNQLVHTAAIELTRQCPDALCIALHPGTVATPLSSPFAKNGLQVREPLDAAQRLLNVVNTLDADSTGGFFDYSGKRIPW